jgi:hypothetical protein
MSLLDVFFASKMSNRYIICLLIVVIRRNLGLFLLMICHKGLCGPKSVQTSSPSGGGGTEKVLSKKLVEVERGVQGWESS